AAAGTRARRGGGPGRSAPERAPGLDPPAVRKLVTSLAEKVVSLHAALEAGALPHAFGGALALAWCTRQPRGTSDIDVNVFVPTSAVKLVLGALPPGITRT